MSDQIEQFTLEYLQTAMSATGRLVALCVEIGASAHIDTEKLAGDFAAQGLRAARLLGLYWDDDAL